MNQIQSIENGQQAADLLTIYAQVTGTVIHKNTQEGSYVKTGMNIYTIADLSQVWILLELYESDLSFVKVGQQVAFNTVSIPGQRFLGTISFIEPVLDNLSRTLKVRVEAQNPNGLLKPDMFVQASVVISSQKSDELPLVIPVSAALVTGKDRKSVV